MTHHIMTQAIGFPRVFFFVNRDSAFAELDIEVRLYEDYTEPSHPLPEETVMKMLSFNRLALCFVAVGSIVVACSSTNSGGGPKGSGGSGSGGSGTGGSSEPPGTGGQGTGGAAHGTGGATQATGGTMAGTGGRGSGGTTTGAGGATESTGGTTAGTGGRGSGGATTATGGRGSGGQTGGGTAGGGGGTGTGGGTSPGGQAGGGSTGTGAGGSTTTGGSTGLAGPAVPSDGCGKATTATTGANQTITVSSSSRTYDLKLPASYDENHPYRLIVSYHWLGGTAANVSTGSGGVIKPWYDLDTTAASNGTTVFVAPQGISNGWSNTSGADVEFSRQLITQLESTICIDKARIFCEGFSMGGSMSYAMASAMPDVIRAVAVHSGGPMSGTTPGHSKPVAYFMTHGTQDTVCTWPSFGLPQLEDFAKVNGCKTPDPTLSATAFQAALPQPTSTAGVCLEFTGCTAGYPTRSCLFVGPHTPSPDNTDGWVPKETWKFFSQF
jgi:poly(3-hydroxybutyrate) depolymerase